MGRHPRGDDGWGADADQVERAVTNVDPPQLQRLALRQLLEHARLEGGRLLREHRRDRSEAVAELPVAGCRQQEALTGRQRQLLEAVMPGHRLQI